MGWKGRFYKLFSSLRFTRRSVELSEDVLLVETRLLEGQIRTGGAIEPGRLTIGFYETPEGARLSGQAAGERRMTLSYGGCKWDGVANAPATSLAIHFAPALTAQIVSPEAHPHLLARLPSALGEKLSYVCAITDPGESLRTAIKSVLNIAEQNAETGGDPAIFDWAVDDLASKAACLIDELVGRDDLPAAGADKHYELARRIEDLLWIDPKQDPDAPTSLDEIAQRLGYSRRSIQHVVQGHFGVGFVVLKRLIRLHQADAALREGSYKRNITRLALDHQFDHMGRFSQYFREVFGILPSTLSQRLHPPDGGA